jgi:hypothetical protein
VLAEQYRYMVEQLGGYCGAGVSELGCGATTDLQLHHVDGKAWTANKVGPLVRSRRLFEDFLMGRLGVLCRECNQRDGAQRWRHYRARKEAPAPF